jgi:flagellar motor protein MotB
MMSAWNRLALAAALAAGLSAVGCGHTSTIKSLQDENAKLSRAVDDLTRRNATLESENATLKASGPITKAYIEKLEEEAALAKRLQELMGEAPEGTTVIRGGWRLESDHFFRSGSDDISKEGVASLKKLAAVLKSEGVFVRVVGHTDSDPIKVSARENPTKMNLELGARRATAVASELKKAGVEETMIHTVSMGQATPVAANDTKENKKKNRRVDILVSKNPPEGFVASKSGGDGGGAPAAKDEPTK